MLTIGNIWDMMNSSTPLVSVLEQIITSLQKEMDYMFVALVQRISKDGKNVFVLKNSLSEKNDTKTPEAEKDFLPEKALNENKILISQNIQKIVNTLWDDDNEDVPKMLAMGKNVICVPLYSKSSKISSDKEPFGDLMLFTDRDEITDGELKFLSLFANQTGLVITIAKLFEEVRKQAVTDPLTGLYNRRCFEENLEKEAERAFRLGQPFSLISLDLDHLKQINDTYGHHCGDEAITAISSVLKNKARSVDIPARIGGEEFSILLPGIDSNGAVTAAERFRAAIEATHVEKVGHVTASIGVATFLEHTKNLNELTELADRAMYLAKINGRNRVRSAEKQLSEDWQKIAVNAFLDIITKKRVPVPEETSSTIIRKLSEINSDHALSDAVDLITQTYNSNFKSGETRLKLKLADILAEKIKMDKEETEQLKLALLLYDIGNLLIPEKILNKTGELSEEEIKTVKSHPILAAKEILKPIDSMGKIIPIIERHHENWDGSGYPQNLKGDNIPRASQIILLIDAFFAMTDERPYRKAYDTETALDIITSDTGKKWSKDLVDTFVPIIKNNEFKR